VNWVMGLICLELVHGFDVSAINRLNTNLEKFKSVPLKDCNFRYIYIYHCYLTYLWSSHESMTCEVNCIYLTLQSFNAIDQPVRLAYQPSAKSTFLSEQSSHQQPANSTFLSE
jgi:hypothetical protein